ncbi:MAG: NAD(P)/FAD-dependent oxidoreductase [Pikeienuella sp.]
MDLLTANDHAGEYPASWYAATATPAPQRPAASGAVKTDVCIVGAGFTGLSAALHLAQRGYSVKVVEAQRVGFGASGRNGGQVGMGHRIDQDELEDMVGDADARRLWDIAVQSVDLVRDLCAKMGETFTPGIIHADHRARFVPHSLAYARMLNEKYGYDQVRGLERDEMRAMVGSDAYHGGSIDLGSGHIHPLRFALGLAQMAEDAGATIHEGCKVISAENGVVKTDAAEITADHTLLACNGYLGALNDRVAARVMPINNFILATEPMDAAQQAALIANNHAVADSKFVVNYYRFGEDGRLLFGGSESYGYRFPNNIGAKVRKAMLAIYPGLKDTRIDYAWGGTLAITMNRMPHFERLAGNMLSCSGYSGHGVALATLAGQIAAETVAGQAERFDLMAKVPTQRFPGGAALRSPLLALAMLWFSLRDRL